MQISYPRSMILRRTLNIVRSIPSPQPNPTSVGQYIDFQYTLNLSSPLAPPPLHSTFHRPTRRRMYHSCRSFLCPPAQVYCFPATEYSGACGIYLSYLCQLISHLRTSLYVRTCIFVLCVPFPFRVMSRVGCPGGHQERPRGRRTQSRPGYPYTLSQETPQTYGRSEQTSPNGDRSNSSSNNSGRFWLGPHCPSPGEGKSSGGRKGAGTRQRTDPELGFGPDKGGVGLPQEPDQRSQYAAGGEHRLVYDPLSTEDLDLVKSCCSEHLLKHNMHDALLIILTAAI